MIADTVVKDAQERTGIHQLHTDSFREGLAVVEAVVNADDPDDHRDRRIHIECTKALMSRLRVDDWIARHPHVLDVPVERPVFVVGMPRTGTTVLVNLIGQDHEQCRVLWHWEIDNPTPPVERAHILDDPRIAAKIAKLAPLRERLAHFPRMELATDPVECVHVLAQDFRSVTWQTSTGSTRFNDWLLDEADLRPAYRHHRRTLQVLQSAGAGGQWVLKLPSHALHLEALVAVYPDARLVFTHRDPLPALVSMCSYATMIHEANGNPIDRDELVAATLRQVLESALRPIAFRAAHPEIPCFELYQHDLATDPIGQVTALFDWIGLPVSSTLADRMERYLATQWAHQPGTHRYSAADFGITRASVDETFAPYLERVDIDMETT